MTTTPRRYRTESAVLCNEIKRVKISMKLSVLILTLLTYKKITFEIIEVIINVFSTIFIMTEFDGT